MTRDERPLRELPAWLWLALALALAAQLAWRTQEPSPRVREAELPPAPSAAALRLAAFGEPEAAARLAMLYLQAFDYGGANATPYRRLDYGRLIDWLSAILELDPKSDYPLFAAARVYAENPDPAKSRQVLDFIYRQFFADPNRRWAALAHAALLAKHRLHDLPLARRYAAAIQRNARSPDVPLWARQMEVFILEDMNELDAARIMLGGMLASGTIQDADEARFLRQQLEDLERRTGRK